VELDGGFLRQSQSSSCILCTVHQYNVQDERVGYRVDQQIPGQISAVYPPNTTVI